MCVNVIVLLLKSTVINTVVTSDLPIIGLVINIGHYCRLFLVSVSVILKDVTNIEKSTSIMSFLVINCLYDTHSY